MSDYFTYNRWHDSVKLLGQAVREMEKAPEETKNQIASCVIILVERYEWLKNDHYSLKELGREKIQGLHKSKTRRRWYDEDPVVHKAFNYIYILNDNAKREIAFKIILSLNAVKKFNKSNKLPVLNPKTARLNIIESIFDKNSDKLKAMVDIYEKGSETVDAGIFTFEMLDASAMQIEQVETTKEVSADELFTSQSHKLRIS